MKLPTLAGIAGIAVSCLLAGCSTDSTMTNHWHINSVGTSMSHHLLGYRPAMDGLEYAPVLAEDGDDLWLLTQRHIICVNPTNPLLPQEEKKKSPPPQPPDVEF